jgi:fructokinase
VLARADVVKVSEDDMAWLDPGREPVEAARALLAGGAAVALLTRGPDGAVVVFPDRELVVPAVDADVVDTIGAGDALGGGFVAWWHERGLGRAELHDAARVVEATHFAARVAARTVERAGASPPRRSELT